jgi:hypothetical protein
MKRLFILILALAPFISSCKKDNESDLNNQIREIAWNSLSEHEKSTVIIDWQESPVTATTYNEKSAYAVSFNTSDDALLGPITVYIERTSLTVLGQGLRL